MGIVIENNVIFSPIRNSSCFETVVPRKPLRESQRLYSAWDTRIHSFILNFSQYLQNIWPLHAKLATFTLWTPTDSFFLTVFTKHLVITSTDLITFNHSLNMYRNIYASLTCTEQCHSTITRKWQSHEATDTVLRTHFQTLISSLSYTGISHVISLLNIHTVSLWAENTLK